MKKLASKAKQLNLRTKARVQERKEKLRRELELRRLKRIRRKNNIPPYRYCKNCGTELKGMYCHECGQYAMDSRQPFWKYFLQYFENVYQFDTKIGSTLWLLFRRPGFLTTEFNAGKIASYVHPMRLFMCITLVFFIFFFMVLGKKADTVFDPSEEDEVIELYIDNNGSSGGSDGANDISSGYAASVPENEFIEKYLEDLSSYSPIISLLFVPIMAFLLKLLYRKKQMKYMAHLAFSFHWGCFFYIALALFCIVGWLWKFDGLPFYLFLAANLLYTTVALHWVYGNGWVKSFLKTAVIYLFYFIAGVFFVGVSFALVYSSFGKDYGLL